MLTDPQLKSKVDALWDRFWSGRTILVHNYIGDQARCLRVVQSVFLQRRKLELADLYLEPFTDFGANAVEKLIGERGIAELIELAKRLAA